MRPSKLAVIAFALALGGCYSTTISSGKPVGETPLEGDDKWHSGFVAGTQEAIGSYDLTRSARRVVRIPTHTTFATGS